MSNIPYPHPPAVIYSHPATLAAAASNREISAQRRSGDTSVALPTTSRPSPLSTPA